MPSMLTSDAERYRMSAALAEEQAQRARSEQHKLCWLQIAAGYRLLAQRASSHAAEADGERAPGIE